MPQVARMGVLLLLIVGSTFHTALGCADTPTFFAGGPSFLPAADCARAVPFVAQWVAQIPAVRLCGWSVEELKPYLSGPPAWLPLVSTSSLLSEHCCATCAALSTPMSPPLPPVPPPPPLNPAPAGCSDVPPVANTGALPCAELLPLTAQQIGLPVSTLCSSNPSSIFGTSWVPPVAVSASTIVYDLCNCTCGAYSEPPFPLHGNILEAIRGVSVGRHLRFGLLNYDLPPLYRYSEATGRHTGFLIELIDRLAAEMGFSYEIGAGTVGGLEWRLQGALGVDLAGYGSGGSIDVLLADLSSALQRGCSAQPVEQCLFDFAQAELRPPQVAQFERSAALFTPPIYTARYSGLVRFGERPISPWRIVEPLAPDAWMATGAVLAAISLLMGLVNALAPEGRPRSLSASLRALCRAAAGGPRTLASGLASAASQTATAMYHTSATCLGGEVYEWQPTWASRLLRTSLLLFVIVLVATYTANLASFCTRPSTFTYGPTSLTELRRSTTCLTNAYLSRGLARQFLNATVALPGSEQNPLTAATRYALEPSLLARGAAFCLDAVASDAAGIWVEDANYLNTVHLAECGTTDLAGWLQVGSIQYGFATRADTPLGRQLAVNLSKAVSLLLNSPEYVRAEAEAFRTGERCERELLGDDLDRISFEEMEGLFYLSGCLAAAAVAVAFLGSLHREWLECAGGGKRPSNAAEDGERRRDATASLPPLAPEPAVTSLEQLAADPNATDGQMLRALLLQHEALARSHQSLLSTLADAGHPNKGMALVADAELTTTHAAAPRPQVLQAEVVRRAGRGCQAARGEARREERGPPRGDGADPKYYL